MVVRQQVDRLTPSLERRIAATRAEMERRQAEGADPSEELSAFVRETFAQEALAQSYREYFDNPHDWLETDDDLLRDER